MSDKTNVWISYRMRWFLLLVLAAGGGCGSTMNPIDFWFNNTETLGGTVPGQRSYIQIAFVNNTPYRAIFTFGTYDPLNTDQEGPLAFAISFEQFYIDANPNYRLERNSTSQTYGFWCGRAIGVGDAALVDIIEKYEFENTTSGAPIYPEALRPLVDEKTGKNKAGIIFSDQPLDAEDAGTHITAWASGVVTLQGADYPCEALVTYTFDLDDTQPGGVRVTTEVILP